MFLTHLSEPGFSDEDAMQARYLRESGVTEHVLVLSDSPTVDAVTAYVALFAASAAEGEATAALAWWDPFAFLMPLPATDEVEVLVPKPKSETLRSESCFIGSGNYRMNVALPFLCLSKLILAR